MAASGDTIVTPGRKTHWRFDFGGDYVGVTPIFGVSRAGAEITPDASLSSNVELLGTGAWTLQPVQHSTESPGETMAGQAAIIPESGWQLAAGVKAVNRWRAPSDLLGVTLDAGVAATGDPFLRKTVAAGGSWGSTLASDEAAFPGPTNLLTTQNLRMDRIAASTAAYPAEQPCHVRWETVGTRVTRPDQDLMFTFGGPASDDGSGQYAVIIGGAGVMILAERVNATWIERAHWRYDSPSGRAKGLHTLTIWPHRDARGRGYIAFRHEVVGVARSWQVAGMKNPLVTGYYVPKAKTDSWEYQVPGGITPQRPTVTGVGQFRIHARQDQRTHVQVSTLAFPASGMLVDAPFALPDNFNPAADLTLIWRGVTPTGASLQGAIYDADTGVELTQTSDNAYWRTFTPNAGQTRYYAAFMFTPDGAGQVAPLLWGYTVQQNGVQQAQSGLTEFTGGVLRDLGITGPDNDPSHDSADITLDDLANQLSTLRLRASIRTRIETEYDPNDSTKRSVLFDGYCEKALARLRGYNAGQDYPSPNWYQFRCSFVGMWRRLHEQFIWQRRALAGGIDTPPDSQGIFQPDKVTDVVREFIQNCGYPSSMVDVPDNALRFFPTPGGEDALMVQPLQVPGEFAVKALRDYLGWYLLWDANAGPNGIWRAVQPPVSPYRNLANFTLSSPAGALPHRPESYANTQGLWLSTDTANATVPVFRENGEPTWESWVKPPEANWLTVSGTGQLTPDGAGQFQNAQRAFNLASADLFVDGSGNVKHTADPTNPDYLGRDVPLVIIDPSLQDCDSVNFAARRYYALACHAVKMATFVAPLVLVTDSQDTYQSNPRPLRYYDPVTVDGTQWLVRSCNPRWTHDGLQFAQYELENPVTL